MSDTPEAITLNDKGEWTGFEWTAEDRKQFRDRIEGPREERRRLHQLYSDGKAQLDTADGRLALQADRVGELAERLSSGEPGELSAEDATCLCYLASAWLLRKNLDEMVRADPRVEHDPDKSPCTFLASECLVSIGRGGIRR